MYGSWDKEESPYKKKFKDGILYWETAFKSSSRCAWYDAKWKKKVLRIPNTSAAESL